MGHFEGSGKGFRKEEEGDLEQALAEFGLGEKDTGKGSVLRAEAIEEGGSEDPEADELKARVEGGDTIEPMDLR